MIKTPPAQECSLRQESADGYNSERVYKSQKVDFKEWITIRSVSIIARVKPLISAAFVLNRV